MFRQIFSSARESRLRRRLRREAAQSRPAFSETLHRHICSAVDRAEAAPASRVPAAGPPWRRLAWAAAAACLLCALVAGWRLREADLPPADTAAASPMADLAAIGRLTDSAAVGLNGLAASIELTPPPARLSSDARLTAEALIERLPVDLELASE
jgi:hypothetical protein